MCGTAACWSDSWAGSLRGRGRSQLFQKGRGRTRSRCDALEGACCLGPPLCVFTFWIVAKCSHRGFASARLLSFSVSPLHHKGAGDVWNTVRVCLWDSYNFNWWVFLFFFFMQEIPLSVTYVSTSFTVVLLNNLTELIKLYPVLGSPASLLRKWLLIDRWDIQLCHSALWDVTMRAYSGSLMKTLAALWENICLCSLSNIWKVQQTKTECFFSFYWRLQTEAWFALPEFEIFKQTKKNL